MTTNRFMCTVLDEMRMCVKTLNFAYLLSLIEEVQSMGNRMESKLEDINDWNEYGEQLAKLKKEVRALREEKRELSGKAGNEFDIFNRD